MSDRFLPPFPRPFRLGFVLWALLGGLGARSAESWHPGPCLLLDPAWPEARRIPHMSTSDDLVHWRSPWRILEPDPTSPREQGEMQFYCLAGVIARGDLLIGLVKVLRDDLNAEVGVTARELGDTRAHAGIGYTVLAWSRDGEHWRRDTEPFLDRNPEPGSWDRAHAWGDDQVAHPVRWKSGNPASLRGRPVQVVLQVRDGAVFAFSVLP